eukprot:TRINITY_DN14317_c0_g1_i1.p1 TRINITY_DN14317_c0_g1~~TRINITY_DN14317_c0_g1_i1.p1  ORF type:complete len:575 (+),score=139.45 TRINITY_DN14317_c0_g1_i1:39-1763(+)
MSAIGGSISAARMSPGEAALAAERAQRRMSRIATSMEEGPHNKENRRGSIPPPHVKVMRTQRSQATNPAPKMENTISLRYEFGHAVGYYGNHFEDDTTSQNPDYGVFRQTDKLSDVISTLDALENNVASTPYYSKKDALISSYNSDNLELQNEIAEAKRRLAELETMQLKKRNRKKALNKLKTAASLMGRLGRLGRGASAVADVIDEEVDENDEATHDTRNSSISSLKRTHSHEGPTAQATKLASAALNSEDVRRDVEIGKVLRPLKPIPVVTSKSLSYTAIRIRQQRIHKKEKKEDEDQKGENPSGDEDANEKDSGPMLKAATKAAAASSEKEPAPEPAKPPTAEPTEPDEDLLSTMREKLIENVTPGPQLQRIMDEVFLLIDTNNDGDLSLEEVRAFSDCLKTKPSPRELKAIFQVADKDGSGQVEKPEFIAMLRMLEGALKVSAAEMTDQFRGHCISKLFDLLKPRKSGEEEPTLSVSDITALFRTLEVECSQLYELRKINFKTNYSADDIRNLFKDVDEDKSGGIDRKEFVSFVNKLAANIPISQLVFAFTKGKEASLQKLKMRKNLWFA